jgi:hypothetical protein
LIFSLFSDVSDTGAVLRERLPWAPQLGLELYLRMDGYAWLFALLVSFMKCAGGPVRALLHVRSGSGAALFLLPDRVHGGNARHGAFGQFDPAGCVLGADESHLFHVDRLLVSPSRGATP